MNHPPNANKPANKVDWDDPQLQSLLGKIEGWSLENREAHPRRDVLIQVGWGAGGDRKAALVWKRDKVMVLEADFMIPVGEQVQVHILLGDSTQVVWAVVADARQGLRSCDQGTGTRVYWLHEC
jgi:hypothetical protein